MKTDIYYFSTTGNSLYTAKFLKESIADVTIHSMPELLRRQNKIADDILETNAQRVGFIFPLHYGGLPILVEDFVHKLNIKQADYIFAISTCGVPYLGRPFTDLDEILSKKGLKLSASWFLRLVSNYLMLRDTAADWRIRIRYWLADKKLSKIAEMIEKNQSHTTWELRKDWCRKMHDDWINRRPHLDDNFICDVSKCVKCGRCERICPVGNINRPNGAPEWQHHCVECLGCLHICPKQAIDCGEITKGRKRYINWHIESKELLQN